MNISGYKRGKLLRFNSYQNALRPIIGFLFCFLLPSSLGSRWGSCAHMQEPHIQPFICIWNQTWMPGYWSSTSTKKKKDIHRFDQLRLEFKVLLPLAWSSTALKLPVPESLKTLHWAGEKDSKEPQGSALHCQRTYIYPSGLLKQFIFLILLHRTFIGLPCSDVCNFTGMSLAC